VDSLIIFKNAWALKNREEGGLLKKLLAQDRRTRTEK